MEYIIYALLIYLINFKKNLKEKKLFKLWM